MALGLVRAAQGRDEQAELLLRSAAEGFALTQFRGAEPESVRALIEFLEERGRADDAAPFRARLAQLEVAAPAISAAKIA